MNKLKGALVAVTAIVAAGLATPASAVPLSGGFAIIGGVTTGQDLATTNSITFTNPFHVTSAFGDFTSLSTGTIKNFTFSPFAAVQDFLTFAATTLNFDLQTVQITRGSTAAGLTLKVAGTGRFQESGFDDTAGLINLTMQDKGGDHIDLSFSASALAGEGGGGPNVPEPASLALLSAALLGLGFARHRMQRD